MEIGLTAFAGAFAYAVWASRDVALTFLRSKLNEIEKAEQKRALAQVPPLPLGLRALAAEQSEEWAQEQAEKRIRELYIEMGDWSQAEAQYRSELER